MLINCKVVTKGSKSVNGAKTRTGDYRATVCLATTLSGEKLEQLIIFKDQPGKTNEKNATSTNGYCANAKYCFQPKAWNDTESMLKWVNLVLKPYISRKKGIAHLIIDDYTSHKVAIVLKEIRNLGCIVSILPAGSTSQIQVLDVGVNKPFKDNLKRKWVFFMTNENPGNEKNISRQMLSHWIVESFSEISSECIKRTFNKLGFY